MILWPEKAPFHKIAKCSFFLSLGVYGRYHTQWNDQDNFWESHYELVYKPVYEIWCKSDVARLDLYGRYRTQWTDKYNFW